jgi:hypothetical protein
MGAESDGSMILQGKTEEVRENPVPVPLCPPHIQHGLTPEQTRPSVTGRREPWYGREEWVVEAGRGILGRQGDHSKTFLRSNTLLCLCIRINSTAKNA